MRIFFITLMIVITQAAFAESDPVACDYQVIQAIHILKLDDSATRLQLFWKDQNFINYGGIEKLKGELKQNGSELLFAMNSGIYTKNNEPNGLHIENGKKLMNLYRFDGENKTRLWNDNFSTNPGLFYISKSNEAYIRSLVTKDGDNKYNHAYPSDSEIADYSLAVQSGPVLIKDRVTVGNFKDIRYNRAAVCVYSNKQIGLFYSNAASINCLAQALLAEGCKDALYMDGAIVQAFDQGNHFGNQSNTIVGILGVVK